MNKNNRFADVDSGHAVVAEASILEGTPKIIVTIEIKGAIGDFSEYDDDFTSALDLLRSVMSAEVVDIKLDK